MPFSVNAVQTTKTDLFQVTGQGSVTAVPDTANISFGVTKQASTVTDAQNQTNIAIKNIQDALAKMGVTTNDIKTTSYNVNPNYTNSQTISGYTVTQNIDLKVEPLSKVNQVIDTITQNGANIVGQVNFGFTDSKQQQLEQEARQGAVNDAKEKANALAKAAGVVLGPIINIQENNPQSPIGVPFVAQAKVADASAPTSVTPGESTVTTSITLSYQLY